MMTLNTEVKTCDCAPYLFKTLEGDMVEIIIGAYETGFGTIPAYRWCLIHGWVEKTEVKETPKVTKSESCNKGGCREEHLCHYCGMAKAEREGRSTIYKSIPETPEEKPKPERKYIKKGDFVEIETLTMGYAHGEFLGKKKDSTGRFIYRVKDAYGYTSFGINMRLIRKGKDVG